MFHGSSDYSEHSFTPIDGTIPSLYCHLLETPRFDLLASCYLKGGKRYSKWMGQTRWFHSARRSWRNHLSNLCNSSKRLRLIILNLTRHFSVCQFRQPVMPPPRNRLTSEPAPDHSSGHSTYFIECQSRKNDNHGSLSFRFHCVNVTSLRNSRSSSKL